MKGETMRYTSDVNGYTGVLYGRSSMSIYNADGEETMHTGSRNANTMEELKEIVDSHHIFIKQLQEMFEKGGEKG